MGLAFRGLGLRIKRGLGWASSNRFDWVAVFSFHQHTTPVSPRTDSACLFRASAAGLVIAVASLDRSSMDNASSGKGAGGAVRRHRVPKSAPLDRDRVLHYDLCKHAADGTCFWTLLLR